MSRLPNSNDALIIEARSHLTLAVNSLDAYDKALNSIWWNQTRVATKNSVRAKLRTYAFDAYHSLFTAGKLLNQYVDSTGLTESQFIDEHPQWYEMMHGLNSASYSFLKEHSEQIQWKQLNLFE